MFRSPPARCHLLLCGLLLSATAAPGQVVSPAPPSRRVVVVVDGSAGLREMAGDLCKAVVEACPDLEVWSFPWSHGHGRLFADLWHHSHHRAKGKELADLLLHQRRTCPSGKIYIVCHSAGAAVVLAAAGCLPPHTIDRIVLLAPAVSPEYDLRPALCCSREGIDSFYSSRDLISRLMCLVGTADGHWQCSAGCVGFTPVGDGWAEEGLYRNLRQYAWQKEMAEASHHGGHFGCTQLDFFRCYVIPLLNSCPEGPGHLTPATR
jgi:hypothetical protein